MKKIFYGLVVAILLVSINVKADALDDAFAEVAPNDTLTFNAYKPDDFSEEIRDFYLDDFFSSNEEFSLKGYSGTFVNCNTAATTCVLSLDVAGETKEKELSVVWHEANATATNKVASIIQKIKDNKQGSQGNMAVYYLEDEELLDFFKNNGKMITYSKAFTSYFDDNKVTYVFDPRGGGSDAFSFENIGNLYLYYDGVLAGITGFSFGRRNVLYVPTDTATTDAQLIAAVKARFSDVEVAVGGKRTSVNDVDYESLADVTKMSDNYYNVTMGESTLAFVIVRDSSKITAGSNGNENNNNNNNNQDVTLENNTNNVTVVVPGGQIPEDAKLLVIVVDENSEVYQKIIDVLGTDKFKAFDISLNSESENKNITKLENGNFRVTVKLGEEYIGKKVAAYFITADNKVEKYDVVMDDDGNGTFETPHFSTYVFAEEDDVSDDVDYAVVEEDASNVGEDVPKTFDGIMTYVVLLIISIVCISATLVLKRKH